MPQSYFKIEFLILTLNLKSLVIYVDFCLVLVLKGGLAQTNSKN